MENSLEYELNAKETICVEYIIILSSQETTMVAPVAPVV